MKENKVAVLGGGDGGHAVAADLALRGVSVNLYDLPEFASGLEGAMQTGQIELTGQLTGIAKLNLVTTNIEEALENVEAIFVVARSNADALFAEALFPYIEDGQTIVLFAGNCGSLVFVNKLREKGVQKDVVIAETVSLPYGVRTYPTTHQGGPRNIRVLFLLRRLMFGVFPAKRTREVVSRIKKFFPIFTPVKNVLAAALGNPNPLTHSAPTILNIGRIERVTDFELFSEGFSESVIKVVIAIEEERDSICNTLGLDLRWAKLRSIRDSTENIMRRFFASQGCVPSEGVEEAFHTKGPMEEISKVRYITEDVPYGLVTWSSFGRMVGVETPTIDSIIQLASVINGVDYMREGRTIEVLGISDLSLEQLDDFLYNG